MSSVTFKNVFHVVDTPGLDNAGLEEERENKRSISNAFQSSPLQVLVCVVGITNGRLRESDISTCNIIRESYGFEGSQSIVILNKYDKYSAPADYQFKTRTELIGNNNLPWMDPNRVLFLENLNDEISELSKPEDIYSVPVVVEFRNSFVSLMGSAVKVGPMRLRPSLSVSID
eukprot:gene31722-39186_t